MTTTEKFKKLVELLYKRTAERKIDWHYDSAVWTRLADLNIRLSTDVNQNFEPLEVVEICSDDWTAIDSFNDETFEGEHTNLTGVETNYWKVMRSTREMAHRQAIGADEAIDDLLNALDDDDVPF